MTFGISPSLISDIERQRKIEADAHHDGLLRYVQDRQYQSATDSKPVRQFMGNLLKALSDGILAEQRVLKKAQGQKLPKYGLPLLSLTPDKLALITVGTLLNAIISFEFEDRSPPATPLGYDIGQVCRRERLFDCLQNRQIDVARELSSRNRSRNAARRADELARKLDDDDDWAKNYRSYHLGEKLIALAIRFAQFEGQRVFELKTVRETDAGGTKTSQRIALTTAASE